MLVVVGERGGRRRVERKGWVMWKKEVVSWRKQYMTWKKMIDMSNVIWTFISMLSINNDPLTAGTKIELF